MGVVDIVSPHSIVPFGYWGLGNDGGIANRGSAAYKSSLPGIGVSATNVVGMASTPSGQGYWMVLASGGGSIYTFGDAQYLGGGGLSNPVVGIAAYPGPAQGYWFVDNQGYVGYCGAAPFHGGGGLSDVAGIIATADGNGYWILTHTGGVHPYGSAAGISSFSPAYNLVMGQCTPDGGGFMVADALGHVYALGNADFQGGLPEINITSPPAFVTGLAMDASGGGYWLTDYNGNVYSFGDAQYQGADLP